METPLHFIDLRESIGSGAFGTVFKGYTKYNHTPVAIKRIVKDNVTGMADYKALSAANGHQNIVQLLDLHRQPDFIYIIMEYCNKGDLVNFLSTGVPSYRVKLDIMRQCAAGVSYIHGLSPPLVHRDIKPQNILLHESPSGVTVKLCDFGLAKLFSDLTGSISGLYMSTRVGTPAFMAPELLMSELQYTAMVDNYALGLVFAVIANYRANYSANYKEMLPHAVDFLRDPYFSFGQRQTLARDGNQPPPSLYLCPQFAGNHPRMISVIVDMTDIDPGKRTKMPQAEAAINQEIKDLEQSLMQQAFATNLM